MDLTNPYGTAFGLMDEVYGPGTAQALLDSGGPWELYENREWLPITSTPYSASLAYRLKPQPPKPREFWLFWSESRFEWLMATNREYAEERHQSEAFKIIHVREVIE